MLQAVRFVHGVGKAIDGRRFPAIGADGRAGQHALDRGLEAVGQIALGLGPSGAKAGAAMKRQHLAEIPRIGRRWLVRLPGLGRAPRPTRLRGGVHASNRLLTT